MFVLIAAILLVACTSPAELSPQRLPKVEITWEEPLILSAGGYTRVHPLSDGRLMCSYTHGGRGYARYSDDGGSTWTDEAVIQTESVMWNSLTCLGGDTILACCMYNGKVTLVRGTVRLKD